VSTTYYLFGFVDVDGARGFPHWIVAGTSI
jgi:hypothetical protein